MNPTRSGRGAPWRRTAAHVAALATLLLPAFPDEPPPPAAGGGVRETMRFTVSPEGRLESDLDGEWIAATGGVEARYGTFVLRADSTVWFPEASVCYAEGGVVFSQGRLHGIADSLWVLLRAGDVARGELRHVRLRFPGHAQVQDVHVSSNLAFFETEASGDGVVERTFRMPRSHVALCRHGVPHVVVASRHATMRFREIPPAVEGTAGEPERILSARGSVLKIGRWPVLPLPPFRHSLDSPWQLQPHWGQTELLGAYQGLTAILTQRERSSPWLHRSAALSRAKWIGTVDHYDTRGWAAGAGTQLSGPRLQGFLDAYGIQDHGRDREFTELERSDRWRWRTFQRYDIDDDRQIDLEAHVLSDPDFRDVYFEREAKSGKAIENRFLYTHRFDGAAFTLLQKNRVNDFLDEVESMPRARLEVFSHEMPGGLLYRSETEAANLRRVRADTPSGPGESFRRYRFDTLQHVSRPFNTGPVQWEPFGSVRQTWWSRERPDRDGESIWRGIGSYGASVSTEFWRAWGDPAGTRLRHKIVPQATFTSVQVPTALPRQIDPFDGIDNLSASEGIALELRQSLEEKTGRDGEPRRVAALTYGSTLFTHPGRDHLVADVDGIPQARRFGPVRQEARYDPMTALRFASDLDYEPYHGVVTSATLGAAWNGGAWEDAIDRRGRARISGDLSQGRVSADAPFSDLIVAVEHRYVREGADTVATRLGTRLGDRWTAAAEAEFSLDNGTAIRERRVTLRRDQHDYVVELALETASDGEISFRFRISPHGFDPGLGMGAQ